MKITMKIKLDEFDVEDLVHWKEWMQRNIATEGEAIGFECALRSLIRQWRVVSKFREDEMASHEAKT